MQDKIKSVLPLTKYNLLASNVHIAPNSAWFNTVKPATVEVCNGNKYGIIGTSPIDLYKRSKVGVLQKEVQVDKVKETIQDIQKEADKLQKQGINKIILLSHLGYTLDKIVANQTQGIDVILGGHSHDLLLDVKEGENLFYSKTGEPVK